MIFPLPRTTHSRNYKFMVHSWRCNIFLAFQEKSRQRMLDSCTMYIWPGLVFSYGNWEAELIKAADTGRRVCYFTKLHSTQSYLMAYHGSSLVNEALQTPEKTPLHMPEIWLLHCQKKWCVLPSFLFDLLIDET